MSASLTEDDAKEQDQQVVGEANTTPSLPAAAAREAAIASLKASATVQDFLTQVVKEYQESRAQWETASAVLKKAQTNLAANRIGKGQIPSYVSSARPPANTTAPASLYANIVDQLKKHEQDGIQIVLKARVEIAQKTLDWYKGKINVQSLVALKQEEFAQNHLLSYADKYDAVFAGTGDEDSKFPRIVMRTWMVNELMARITDEFTRGVQRQESEEQAKKDEIAKDLAAQEQVMAGAHNGQTLKAMIAEMLEEREAAAKLKENNGTNNAAAAPAAGVTAATNSKPQEKLLPGRQDERSTAGHKRARSPGSHQEAASRPFPGNRSNGPRRPFHGGQARGYPNSRRSHSPPKNGAGGDRHNEAHQQYRPWHPGYPPYHDRYSAPPHHMQDDHGEGRGWNERPPEQWPRDRRHH